MERKKLLKPLDQFNALCSKRTQRHEFFDLQHTPEKHHDDTPFNYIYEGENPFTVWYEEFGCDQTQVSEILGISVQQCRKIEENFSEIPYPVLVHFCESFSHHPVNMVPNINPAPAVLVDYLIDVYYNFTAPYSYEVERKQDVKVALANEADPDFSLDRMRDLLHKNEIGASPDRRAITELLTVLLDNDGNPALGGFGADEVADMVEQRLCDSVEGAHRRLTGSKQAILRLDDKIDDSGYEFFGYEWNDHRCLLRDAMFESGESFAKSFFLEDILPVQEMEHGSKRSFWNRFNIRQHIDRQKEIYDVEFYTSVQTLKAFQAFRAEHADTFNYYNNRQAILAMNDPELATAEGNIESPYYLKLDDQSMADMQVKISLRQLRPQ
tara:strand:- start:387 stop:1532 length:1146 start_codon:yes stop_codon:yes gene_type:complete